MAGEGESTGERSWSDLQVGLRVGPLTYQISPEMVIDYCQAMPIDPAPYNDADAVMPPTMLATDYVPLLRGQLALGWGLMARHTMRSLRAIKVGDTVTVAGEIVDKFERKGRHYWTLAYQVANQAGEVCLDSRITCSVD